MLLLTVGLHDRSFASMQSFFTNLQESSRHNLVDSSKNRTSFTLLGPLE